MRIGPIHIWVAIGISIGVLLNFIAGQIPTGAYALMSIAYVVIVLSILMMLLGGYIFHKWEQEIWVGRASTSGFRVSEYGHVQIQDGRRFRVVEVDWDGEPVIKKDKDVCATFNRTNNKLIG